MGEQKAVKKSEIPKYELESLARVLLPEIQIYFESDEGKREFEQWKRQKMEKANYPLT